MIEPLPFDEVDEDLQKIIADRAFAKLRELRESLKVYECGQKSPIPQDDQKFWGHYFEHICQREIFVKAPDEVRRYEKTYKGCEYEKDIDRARGGDTESLCRIIAWDKAWFSIDWVKEKISEKILEANENEDFEVLEDVGRAISKKPRVRKTVRAKNKKDKENTKLILALVETALIYHKIGLPADGSNPIVKKLHDVLVEQEFCPEALLDPDYFPKFLRRHALIR